MAYVKEAFMEKILRGVILLCIMLGTILSTGICSQGASSEEKYHTEEEDYEGEGYYTDKQGIIYGLDESEESSSEDYYIVSSFKQSYDEAGKPRYTKLVIANEIYGKPVKYIGSAFTGHKELTSIKICKNAETIWKSFEGCAGLKEMDLVNVSEIDEAGFKDCTSLVRLTKQKK